VLAFGQLPVTRVRTVRPATSNIVRRALDRVRSEKERAAAVDAGFGEGGARIAAVARDEAGRNVAASLVPRRTETSPESALAITRLPRA
jgi:hypothetical protein